jgi:rsbT antagonist protein RsbS
VELGLSLDGIATALNMEKGMRRLEAMVADDESLEESESGEDADASTPPGD